MVALKSENWRKRFVRMGGLPAILRQGSRDSSSAGRSPQ
jgi:hypothetical protein